MNIDPYKIPAFKRQNKIVLSKGSFFGINKEPEAKRLERLKKDNLSAIHKNRMMDNGKPVFCDNKQASQTPLGIPSWRKMDQIGEVEQYFAKINVIAFKLQKPLKTGERIIIESPKGLFEQVLISMQINRQDVTNAKKGDDVGIKVRFEPRLGGFVYKVAAEGN